MPPVKPSYIMFALCAALIAFTATVRAQADAARRVAPPSGERYDVAPLPGQPDTSGTADHPWYRLYMQNHDRTAVTAPPDVRVPAYTKACENAATDPTKPADLNLTPADCEGLAQRFVTTPAIGPVPTPAPPQPPVAPTPGAIPSTETPVTPAPEAIPGPAPAITPKAP